MTVIKRENNTNKREREGGKGKREKEMIKMINCMPYRLSLTQIFFVF